jgi:hypothetical protein
LVAPSPGAKIYNFVTLILSRFSGLININLKNKIMKRIKKVILVSIAIAMFGICVFTGSEAQAYVKPVDCYPEYEHNPYHTVVFCLGCVPVNGDGAGTLDTCRPG